VAIHPLDTNIIYVTSPGGGVWKTTNAGNTWTPLTDRNGAWMNMFSVAVDPRNTNIVYAGSNAAQLIKSTDGGATWSSVGRFMSGIVYKILIHPTNSSIIYAAAQNGIFRSTDAGINWTKTYSNSTEDIEFKPGDPSVMYASGPFSPSFARSTDGGLTWTALTATEGITHAARALIGVSPADPNRVYVVQAFGNEFGRMYVSNNSGASFTVSVSGSASGCTNFFGYETTGCGTGGQAGYDMAICVNPANANEVYIGGIIVFRSTDGAKTFTAQTAWSYPNSIGYNHADVHALEWMGKSIYSGTDGGIYISTDRGDNWKDLSKGLGIRQFYRIANAKTNSQVFTGGAQDNGSSLFKNGTWYDWLGADGMDGVISPFDENLVWGTSQNGTIYRSTNGGASYSTLPKPANGEWVTPLDYNEKNKTLYGGWTGVFSSTDNGSTWTKISGNAITTTLTTLAVAPSDPSYIYASRSTTLHYTRDGGTNWATATLPSSINAIAVSPADPMKIWVACNSTANRVFVSVDGGITFTNISDNLPAIIARSLAVTRDESVYLGMNIGVYYRANGATGWTNITSNMPAASINDVLVHEDAGLVRIASYGRGVWEKPLEATSSVVTCGTPTNLTTSEITPSSGKLTWNGVSGANSYKLEYKATTATTWSVLAETLSTNTYTLNGLAAGTVYEWRVAANCDGSSSSQATAQFTTAAAVVVTCNAPTGLATSALTETSATLSWSSVSGALAYRIEYKMASGNTWLTAADNYANTSLTLNGLNAGATYDWRVATLCNGATSGYTAGQFQLVAPCQTPGTLSTTTLTENSATLSWTSVAGAASYTVEYKTTSGTTWTLLASATTTTNVNLSGLTASTQYDWRVRTNCSSSASSFAVASFTTASPVICADNFESNNSSKQSKSLSLGTTTNAKVGTATDEDWFRFSTGNTSSTNIRVTLSELPDDYDLYLYDKNIRLIGSSVNTGNSSETIVFNSSTTRTTYYVRVVGKSGRFNNNSCYALTPENSTMPWSPAPGVAYYSETQDEETAVFPNPVSTRVNLRFKSESDGEATLTLTNAAGVTIKASPIAVSKGMNQASLNVQDVKPGMYLMKVRNQQLNITKQVIVVH
jgi:photosystem II stability/assembly factor-like uncharacterized protein